MRNGKSEKVHTPALYIAGVYKRNKTSFLRLKIPLHIPYPFLRVERSRVNLVSRASCLFAIFILIFLKTKKARHPLVDYASWLAKRFFVIYVRFRKKKFMQRNFRNSNQKIANIRISGWKQQSMRRLCLDY